MASKDSTGFYVYVHRKNSDGQIFYVGKGMGNRALSRHGRNNYWHNVVNKHGYTVEIVLDGIEEPIAFELECELIAFYGRENLTNLCDGGQGASGRMVGDNEKRIKSELFKGRQLTQETKDKISKSRQGMVSYYPNEMQRLAMSLRTKGRKAPWSTGEKNHMKTKESREKMSLLLKGRKTPWIQGDKNPAHKQANKDATSARCKGVKRPEITGVNHKLAKKVICIHLNALCF